MIRLNSVSLVSCTAASFALDLTQQAGNVISYPVRQLTILLRMCMCFASFNRGITHKCCPISCVCSGCCVFGVPLVELVTSQGDEIPKIIRRVVEHVEKTGMSVWVRWGGDIQCTVVHVHVPLIMLFMHTCILCEQHQSA